MREVAVDNWLDFFRNSISLDKCELGVLKSDDGDDDDTNGFRREND